MKVLAKFRCIHVADCPSYQTKIVSFVPVMNDCEENKSFAKFIPAGDIKLYISYDTPASTSFEEDKEYFVTFENIAQ